MMNLKNTFFPIVMKALFCIIVAMFSWSAFAEKQISVLDALADVQGDLYCLDSIDRLYVRNPDLALIRIDSLRRRCEAKGWKGCERARLEMINSIIYTYKEDPGNILRYAYNVLDVTEKLSDDDDVFWHMMALQYICEAYLSSENWFMTGRTVRNMELLAQKYGGRYVWYESVAQIIRSQMLSRQGQPDKALKAIDRAQAVMERDTSWKGRIIAFQNRLDTERFRAEINAFAGRNGQAKVIYEGLLQFAETGDSTNMDKSLYDLTCMRVYAQLCGVCQELGQTDSAALYYHKVKMLQHEYREGHSLTEPLSNYLYKSGNYDELERVLLPVLTQAWNNQVVTSQVVGYMQTYIRMLQHNKRLSECALWSDRYIILNDSLQARVTRHALEEFVVAYKAKEQEELILTQEHALFQRKVWIVSLAIFVFLLVAGIGLAGWILVKYRQNNRFLYQRIRETNAAFERLTHLAVLPVAEEHSQPTAVALSEEQNTVREVCDLLLKENRFTDKQLSNREILRYCGLSHDTLNKRFHSVIGMNLSEYITALRLEYACRLLSETNLTIDTVAEDSGFNSTRTFLRQFKSRYNLSPTQYRRQ